MVGPKLGSPVSHKCFGQSSLLVRTPYRSTRLKGPLVPHSTETTFDSNSKCFVPTTGLQSNELVEALLELDTRFLGGTAWNFL